MGGDRAPSEIVAGAHLAVEAGIPVLLVGPEGLEERKASAGDYFLRY